MRDDFSHLIGEPEWMDDWRRVEKRKPADDGCITAVVTSFGTLMRGDPGFEEVYIDALETELEQVKRENKRWCNRFMRWWTT